MADSAIEWTDKVWNPVRGCAKVSPGCAHCYAETFAERFRGVPGHPYEQGFDLRLVPDKLTEPLTWKKPRRVFVNSMSDLFQDGVPDGYIDQVFAVMALASQHTFQVLTKRAERMRDYMQRIAGMVEGGVTAFLDTPLAEATRAISRRAGHAIPGNAVFEWFNNDEFWRENKEIAYRTNGFPPRNVWLGVSCENQHFADERIPLLLQTPAAVRFISAEPLLGPVDIEPWLHSYRQRRGLACAMFASGPNQHIVPALDWVIVGGESGHGARPFDVAWARSLVHQCRAAGVACFVKQLGAKPVREAYSALGQEALRAFAGRTNFVETMSLKSRKGGDMAEWPADLRVREFPASEPAA